MKRSSSSARVVEVGFHDRIRVGTTAMGRGVFATTAFEPGEIVVNFEPNFVTEATRYTIQVDELRHLVTEGNPGALLNHHCAPNCAFDSNQLALIALRKIKASEELTFNYLTTEWEMASPFDCMCGAESCKGLIRGYKYSTSDLDKQGSQQNLREYGSNHQ